MNAFFMSLMIIEVDGDCCNLRGPHPLTQLHTHLYPSDVHSLRIEAEKGGGVGCDGLRIGGGGVMGGGQ